MARDVSEILIGICEKEGEMGRTQAMQYVKDLGQKSRYVQDVWSWANIISKSIKTKIRYYLGWEFFNFLNFDFIFFYE